MKRLFSLMEIDETRLETSMAALATHSQAALASKQVKTVDKPDGCVFAAIDRIYADFGVPVSCAMEKDEFVSRMRERRTT